MSARDDGGSAFPIPNDDRPGAYPAEPGMSLRDYFAGQELQRITYAQCIVHDMSSAYARVAGHCYRMADAMLKERNKPAGGLS